MNATVAVEGNRRRALAVVSNVRLCSTSPFSSAWQNLYKRRRGGGRTPSYISCLLDIETTQDVWPDTRVFAHAPPFCAALLHGPAQKKQPHYNTINHESITLIWEVKYSGFKNSVAVASRNRPWNFALFALLASVGSESVPSIIYLNGWTTLARNVIKLLRSNLDRGKKFKSSFVACVWMMYLI